MIIGYYVYLCTIFANYYKMRKRVLCFLIIVLSLVASAEKGTQTRAGYANQTQDFVTDTLPNGQYYLDYFSCDMFVDRLAYKIVSKEDRTVELSCLRTAEMWDDRWIYKMDTMRIPETVTWHDTVYTVVGIGYGALMFSEVNQVEIPKTITAIKQFSFNACEGLKELKLPANIKRYEYGAFSGVTLDLLEFPESIDSIGTHTFGELYPGANGARIEKLVLPKNLEWLTDCMFLAAEIGEMTLPESVKGVGWNTASDRTHIRVLRVEHKDPPAWLLECDTLIVPDGCRDKYVMEFKYLTSPNPRFKVIYEESEYDKMNTAISSPSAVATEQERYSLDGRRLNSPKKGINIIRMSDGTTKKVLVK